MNEPLMSTPMNITRRPRFAPAVWVSPAGLPFTLSSFFSIWPLARSATPFRSTPHPEAMSAAASTTNRSVRMSGHLLVGIRQLRLERAGVLEVADARERQVEHVPVRGQERDEVERGRHELHGRNEERVHQLLALLAGPRQLVP